MKLDEVQVEISSFILLRIVLLILLTILNLGLWYLLTAKLHRTCQTLPKLANVHNMVFSRSHMHE